MWRQALFPLALLLGLLLLPACGEAASPDGQAGGIFAPTFVAADTPGLAEITDLDPDQGRHLALLPAFAKRAAATLSLLPDQRPWALPSSLLLRLIGRQNE